MQRSASGGTCDCGCEESWKREGWCRNHGKETPANLDELIPEPYKSSYEKNMRIILTVVVETIQELINGDEDESMDEQKKLKEDGLAELFELLTTIEEVDMFFLKSSTLISEMKMENTLRLKERYPMITVAQYLIQYCYHPSFTNLDAIHNYMSDMCQNRAFIRENFEFYLDFYLDINAKEEQLSELGIGFNKLFNCQFFSEEKMCNTYFVSSEERVSQFFKIVTSKIVPILETKGIDESLFDTISVSVEAFYSIFRHKNLSIYANKKYFSMYLDIVEMIMYFNEEKRLKEPLEYDSEIEQMFP